jgi:hypothetical protein
MNGDLNDNPAQKRSLEEPGASDKDYIPDKNKICEDKQVGVFKEVEGIGGSGEEKKAEPVKTRRQSSRVQKKNEPKPVVTKSSSPKKKEYKKIKFKGEIYQIGDPVLIKESEEVNSVGTLERVIAQGGSTEHPTWPMIDVKW